MRAVHPKTRERFSSRCAFRLCNLVVVMYRYMFNAAGVNINLLAKNRTGHSRTFNVPSGETFSPRTVPAETWVKFPQSKIGVISLVFVRGNPRPFGLVFRVYASEDAIGGEAGSVKIHPIRRCIRESFLYESRYHRDLRTNISAGARKDDFSGPDIEIVQVSQKYPCVFLSEVQHILQCRLKPLAFKSLRHFVFAFVAVRSQVPDVGDVDDLFYFKIIVLKNFAERIGKNEH